MTLQELQEIFEQIKKSFPTLIKVEPDDEKNSEELVLHLKDFSPKKDEDDVLKINAKIRDIDPETHFHVDIPEEMVECYLFLGSAKYDDVSLINSLLSFSSALFYKKNIQFITFNAGEGFIGFVLRAFIDVDKNNESFSARLLYAVKELLSFHYLMLFENTRVKIEETLDDKEMIDNLMKKHRKTVELLINPETVDSL